jgi:hypothetical protein
MCRARPQALCHCSSLPTYGEDLITRYMSILHGLLVLQ